MPFSEGGKLTLHEGTVAFEKVLVRDEEQHADQPSEEIHQQEEYS